MGIGSRSSGRSRVVMMCVLVAVVSGSCRSSPSSAGTPASNLRDLRSFVQNRAENSDFSEPPVPLLTSMKRAVADDSVFVVVGRVVGGGKGRSFTADARPARGDGVAWKTVHLVVEVSEPLDLDPSARTVSVGLVVDPGMDAARVVSGFVALGRAVFFLNKSAVFAYDPGLYGIGREGSLVASVDDQGMLHLPFMSADTAHAVLPEPLTLGGLRVAARS